MQDVRSALREQWDDGCNVLAIEPGVVVAYKRNVTANVYLQDHGITVIAVRGGELGAGPGRPALHELPDRTRRLTQGRPAAGRAPTRLRP